MWLLECIFYVLPEPVISSAEIAFPNSKSRCWRSLVTVRRLLSRSLVCLTRSTVCLPTYLRLDICLSDCTFVETCLYMCRFYQRDVLCSHLGSRTKPPGHNIPCHFLHPGQKIPQRFAIRDKTSSAVIVTPDKTSHAISDTPDKNVYKDRLSDLSNLGLLDRFNLVQLMTSWRPKWTCDTNLENRASTRRKVCAWPPVSCKNLKRKEQHNSSALVVY